MKIRHVDEDRGLEMSHRFPVMYSMLSSDALGHWVEGQFDVGPVTTCQMLGRGLNDTYIVVTENRRYILRVYRTPWRSQQDVNYEVDVLDFLVQHGVSVSSPIKNRDGEWTSAVQAPEGVRPVVLFTYSEGTRARLDATISYEYGRIVAQIHQVTDAFVPAYDRSQHLSLDLKHLIDEPLRILTPAMAASGGDVAYVQAWVRTIHERLPVAEMEFGFCHGDVHDWNAHWNGCKLTMFDFDCCGPGYRTYDLAVFLWNLKTNYKGRETENWVPFVDGYRAVRPLSDMQLQLIPWLVAARRIWLAGLYLSNEDVWGTSMVNEDFFRSFVDQLKDDEKELDVKIDNP